MISDPDGVSRSLHCREPLFIFEDTTPASCLSGIVVESFECWLSFWIGGCPRIVCETERLARLVRVCLEAEGHRPMPTIRIMEGRRHAA